MPEENLLQRLSKHPKLMQQIEKMLDIAENASGEITLADTAEDYVVMEGRKLNQEFLQTWADNQQEVQAKYFKKQHKKIIKNGKKNFTGTAL